MKVGLIGGGQLAQMLAQAGLPLGIETYCLVADLDCPARYSAQLILGDITDESSLSSFIDKIDVLSFESENIDISFLKNITAIPIQPSLAAIQNCQDRLLEKQLLERLAIPTNRYQQVQTYPGLQQAVDTLGLPAIIKLRRLGYDGKGQYIIRAKEELADVWAKCAGQSIIIEEWVDFDREVSLLAVRNFHGQIEFYPLVENYHQQGILKLSLAPYLDDKLHVLAQQYAKKLLAALNYIGVLCIEFFQCGDRLLVNEIAPRVHNSGHWTMEGAAISQFENHLRAILDLPLGSTQATMHSAMYNFIEEVADLKDLLKIPGLHYHTYNKQPRVGRKLAHATLCCPDPALLAEYCNQLEQYIKR